MRVVSGLTVGIAVGAALSLVGFAVAKAPPPVVLELGPVLPTPLPSPLQADRLRMITSFTLQNKPDGTSIVSFEATDFAKDERKQHRIIATEVYSLTEPKKKLRAQRDGILAQVRQLERELLDYVERAGPPRGREPVTGTNPGR